MCVATTWSPAGGGWSAAGCCGLEGVGDVRQHAPIEPDVRLLGRIQALAAACRPWARAPRQSRRSRRRWSRPWSVASSAACVSSPGVLPRTEGVCVARVFQGGRRMLTPQASWWAHQRVTAAVCDRQHHPRVDTDVGVWNATCEQDDPLAPTPGERQRRWRDGVPCDRAGRHATMGPWDGSRVFERRRSSPCRDGPCATAARACARIAMPAPPSRRTWLCLHLRQHAGHERQQLVQGVEPGRLVGDQMLDAAFPR